MFRNMRILLMCKETYSYPLYFAAKKLQNDNHLAAFFFNSVESVYNPCYLNRTTYYKFKEEEHIRIYDTREIAREFTENLDDPKVNTGFLAQVEKQFTHFKPLGLQILSSQSMTRHYHNRNYLGYCNQKQQEYWLGLNYQRALDVCGDFKPDVVLDCDDAEMMRTIMIEICYSKKIPYITIEHPRYGFFKYPTLQLGYGIDPYFSQLYKKYFDGSGEDIAEELESVRKIRNASTIMAKEFIGTITAKYLRTKLGAIAKSFVGKIMYFVDQERAGDEFGIKNKNELLFPRTLEYLKFYARYEWLNWRLLGKNSLFHEPLAGERYVYMPLHLIPESTTFVKSPFYVNELTVVEAISKALPIGWKLYVKEHQAMLGERSLDFYRRVNQFPNARMVTVNFYPDPKPWIQNAEGVITLAGTSAFEAALLGKRSIVFSDVPFSLIDGITRAKSIEDLPGLIREFAPVENMKSCAAYMAAVKEAGCEVRLKYLMDQGEKIICGQTIDHEFEQEVGNLMNLFEKGYSVFKQQMGVVET